MRIRFRRFGPVGLRGGGRRWVRRGRGGRGRGRRVHGRECSRVCLWGLGRRLGVLVRAVFGGGGEG